MVGVPPPVLGLAAADGAGALPPLPMPAHPVSAAGGGGDGGDGGGDGEDNRGPAKRARTESALPQVDGPADDGGDGGGRAGGGGTAAAPTDAAEPGGVANGGGDGPDDFADIPTSSDDEAGPRPGVPSRDGGTDGAVDGGDLLLATFDRVVRTRNRWKCVLRRVVLRLGGREHLFDSVAGDMTF
jgi:transcription initiation factor TFIIA large subunit